VVRSRFSRSQAVVFRTLHRSGIASRCPTVFRLHGQDDSIIPGPAGRDSSRATSRGIHVQPRVPESRTPRTRLTSIRFAAGALHRSSVREFLSWWHRRATERENLPAAIAFSNYRQLLAKGPRHNRISKTRRQTRVVTRVESTRGAIGEPETLKLVHDLQTGMFRPLPVGAGLLSRSSHQGPLRHAWLRGPGTFEIGNVQQPCLAVLAREPVEQRSRHRVENGPNQRLTVPGP